MRRPYSRGGATGEPAGCKNFFGEEFERWLKIFSFAIQRLNRRQNVLAHDKLRNLQSAHYGNQHAAAHDELMSAARVMAMRAASAPRELAILTKCTIQEMANIATHQQAIAKELEPQVWTTRQPWFAERLAALQSRIKKS